MITEKSVNNGDGDSNDDGRSGGGAKLTKYKSIRSAAHEAHKQEIREHHEKINKKFIGATNAIKVIQQLARPVGKCYVISLLLPYNTK